jgi:hypothetical protein
MRQCQKSYVCASPTSYDYIASHPMYQRAIQHTSSDFQYSLRRRVCDVVMVVVSRARRVARVPLPQQPGRLGKHKPGTDVTPNEPCLVLPYCHNAPHYTLGVPLVHSSLPLLPLTPPFVGASLFIASLASVARRYHENAHRQAAGHPLDELQDDTFAIITGTWGDGSRAGASDALPVLV